VQTLVPAFDGIKLPFYKLPSDGVVNFIRNCAATGLWSDILIVFMLSYESLRYLRKRILMTDEYFTIIENIK